MSKKGGMAPGLLRARRRDASLKPNRVLDKGSSRGMIYENEELRLRTINITSEIERGQSELKKLKRENEHLRREIWALRDEVDRLEALLKQKEQEEEEEEEDEDDEEEENGEEEGPSGEDPPTGDGRSSSGGKTRQRVAASPEGLSVVVEEPEDSSSSTPEPALLTTNSQVLPNGERRLEEWRGALPPCVRLNCVHPYTTAASLPPQLADLAASEVIEAVSTDGGLVGVRLLESSLYLSWRGRGELEHWLEQTGGTGLQLRDQWLQFTDVSQGTVVLALSAIPHSLSQSALLKLISQFGTVIGGVERRMYRGTDTGEGLVRLRPFASLPKRLFHEGAEISVRPLSHGELAALSMEPHQVLRFEKDDRVKMPAGSGSQSSSKTQKLEPINIPTPKSEKEVGVVSFEPRTRGGTSTPSVKSDPFIFPAASLPKKLDERSQSAPLRTDPQATQHGSNSSLRPHSDSEATTGGPRRRKSRRGKSPSSGSEQESPGLPRTPGSVVRRRASLAPPTDRERSLSLSSRAEEVYSKRKMSMTGRETGKLPWCACWGNGCY